MGQKNKNQISFNSEIDVATEFYSQSGLFVKTSDDMWVLSSIGKGNTVDVGWLNSFKFNPILRNTLIDTLIHYAETKTAATVSTQRFALIEAFPNDKVSIDEFKIKWNELKSSTRKTLKGFISTAVKKLNHKHMMEYHEITKEYKHKQIFNALHPTKGRLTDYEYDSLLHNVRTLCAELPTTPPTDLSFYQQRNSPRGQIKRRAFSYFKSVVAYRLMLQLARRPRQIAMLKWSDVLPVGTSFRDTNVDAEPTYIGVKSLHFRCFKIKQNKSDNSWRATPERWTIPISESCSLLILNFRAIYLKGLSLHLEQLGVKGHASEASRLILHCPIIPSHELFTAELTDVKVYNAMKQENSSIFHQSESNIKSYEAQIGKGFSERHGTAQGTNNRLRHTWLCNAAIQGRSLSDISKITNVTIPNARAYLQLGLKERQFIDKNYGANELLREAFNPVTTLEHTDLLIEDEVGVAIGVEKSAPTCQTCQHKTRLVRPIPCYGCSNFRPLLDADHSLILERAEAKRNFMLRFQSNGVNSGALHRIEKAIAFIKLTIAVCDETKRYRNGLSETS